MRSAVALGKSSHPGPTLVVTVLALVLGLATGLDAGRLALLVLAVFAGQLSVGWSNDAIDARRDRDVGRRDKPIARGDVTVRAVWVAAAIAAGIAVALSALLGPLFLVTHLIALASAWSYNLALKNTAISVAPFALSFGLFPSLASLALADPVFAAAWASLAGATLGVAVHFSNVLPDLDDDARTGIRGLPHRLGARASALIAFAAVELGAVAVLAGPLVAGGSFRAVALVGFAAVSVVALFGAVRALRRPDRTVFRLVMFAALLLVIQLAVTGVGVS